MADYDWEAFDRADASLGARQEPHIDDRGDVAAVDTAPSSAAVESIVGEVRWLPDGATTTTPWETSR